MEQMMNAEGAYKNTILTRQRKVMEHIKRAVNKGLFYCYLSPEYFDTEYIQKFLHDLGYTNSFDKSTGRQKISWEEL